MTTKSWNTKYFTNIFINYDIIYIYSIFRFISLYNLLLIIQIIIKRVFCPVNICASFYDIINNACIWERQIVLVVHDLLCFWYENNMFIDIQVLIYCIISYREVFYTICKLFTSYQFKAYAKNTAHRLQNEFKSYE